jgi:hypothetical protein
LRGYRRKPFALLRLEGVAGFHLNDASQSIAAGLRRCEVTVVPLRAQPVGEPVRHDVELGVRDRTGHALLALLAVLAALFIAGQKPRVDGLLAFSRDGAIFLARPDGGGAVRAPRTPGWRLSLAAGPPWSPDGRYLAVAGYPSNPPPDTEPPESVFVLDSRTFELRRIGEGLFIGWSPEGHAVVAPSARSVATYSVDERAIQLIRTVDVGGPVAGDFVSAVLSPDGRWLAVTSGQYLERVDVQTGATTQLYDNGGELVDRTGTAPDDLANLKTIELTAPTSGRMSQNAHCGCFRPPRW